VAEEAAITALCPRCGRPAQPADRYCGGCGTGLADPCPRCGRPYPPGSAYCTGCGLPVPVPAGAAAGPAGPAGAAPADRRRVSILFVDVVGFTRLGERADPEALRGLQHDYFTTVRTVVGQYGGVVEKYIGDAVMALFGAPVATENDALRCVRAGLHLQRVLPVPGPGGPALEFRVGVATGEALVEVANAHDGGQGIASGDVVNAAARLQAIAPPGGVYVDDGTYAATRAAVEYAEQPAQTLRGHSRPSRVWLAVRARTGRAGTGERELTPMLGREHEHALLTTALHRTVRARVPQLVTIFGTAGIGKSRLVGELDRHAAGLADPPVRWRVGYCPPFGENVSYAALAEIVKAHLGIADSDGEEGARARLVAGVRGLVEPDEADQLADALAPLVGLPAPRLPVADAERAWKRFLLAAAREPLVLVFEDMHWADEPMLRFVETLGAAAHGLPLLVLCTARPELRERYPGWTSAIAGTTSISLSPLADADVAGLYSMLLGRAGAAVPAGGVDQLVELADGNPLYAQEYVRMLAEGGGGTAPAPAAHSRDAPAPAAHSRDEPEPTDPVGLTRPPIPANVQAVIANRLDLLDPDDRAVLQAAAVVGRQFWAGAVAAALEQEIEPVRRCLYRLARRDLVQEEPSSSLAGWPEYRFRTVLVRDVCYQRLPRAQRVALHRRTADWLESVPPGSHGDLVEVAAHHRWAAYQVARTGTGGPGPDLVELAGEARRAMHAAARRAYALHTLDGAARWVQRARGLALPDSPALDLFAAELALHRDREAFLAQGGVARLQELCDALLAGADPGAAARAYTLLGGAALSRADRAGTLRYLDRAVELFDPLPDSEEKTAALLELARVHELNFEFEPATAAAEVAADMADKLGLVELRAQADITLAATRYAAGAPDGYAGLGAVAHGCQRRRLAAWRRAAGNVAWATLEEGDVPGAVRRFAEVPAGGAGAGAPDGHELAALEPHPAVRAYLAGDWPAAIAAAVPAGSGWHHPVVLAQWLQLLRGQPADPAGTDLVGAAVRAATRGGFRRVLRATLAHAALHRALQGRTEPAGQLLDELADDCARTPMLGLAAWVAPAAHAGGLLGGASAQRVRAVLTRCARPTPWVTAGLAVLAGAARDDPDQYLAAAAGYGRIGAVSDRALALAGAAAALERAGDRVAAEAVGAEVTAFAHRNGAPGLLAGLDLARVRPRPRPADPPPPWPATSPPGP